MQMDDAIAWVAQAKAEPKIGQLANELYREVCLVCPRQCSPQ